MFLGFGQIPAGVNLAGIGMPDCFQYTTQQVQWLLLVSGSTAPFGLAIPTGTTWSGLHLYVQAATLSSGFNALGALSSNGIDLRLGPN